MHDSLSMAELDANTRGGTFQPITALRCIERHPAAGEDGDEGEEDFLISTGLRSALRLDSFNAFLGYILTTFT